MDANVQSKAYNYASTAVTGIASNVPSQSSVPVHVGGNAGDVGNVPVHDDKKGPVVGGMDSNMQLLLSKMSDININIDSKFGMLQRELRVLREQVSAMKADMVTKSQHDDLAARVLKLESGGAQSPQGRVACEANVAYRSM